MKSVKKAKTVVIVHAKPENDSSPLRWPHSNSGGPIAGAKGGKVCKPLDMELIETLCRMQCTDMEIAAVLKITPAALCQRKGDNPALKELLENGRERGKASLRRTQFKLAERSASMAIHLGKNYLEQTDKVEQTGTPDHAVTVVVNNEISAVLGAYIREVRALVAVPPGESKQLVPGEVSG